MSKALTEKIGLIVFELALVAARWWYFKFVTPLGLTLVGAVLLSGLAPERYSRLASGLAMLGIAGFFYYYDYRQLAMILGGFGLLLTVYGAVTATRRVPRKED